MKKNITDLSAGPLTVIAGCLCWVDAMALRLSAKACRQARLPNIAIEIEKQVKHRFPNNPRFVAALKQTGAALSGGFLLRCLFGIPPDNLVWGPGDVDVFVVGQEIMKRCEKECKECDREDLDYNAHPNSWGGDFRFMQIWNPTTDHLRELHHVEQDFNSVPFHRNSRVEKKEQSKFKCNGPVPGDDDELHYMRKIIALNSYEHQYYQPPRLTFQNSSARQQVHADDIQASRSATKKIAAPLFPDEAIPGKLDYIRVNPRFKGGLPRYIARLFDVSICKIIFEPSNEKQPLRILCLDDLLARQFKHEQKCCSVFGGIGSADYPGEEVQKPNFGGREKLATDLMRKGSERIKKYSDRGFRCISSSFELGTYQTSDWFYSAEEYSRKKLRESGTEDNFENCKAVGPEQMEPSDAEFDEILNSL